MIAKCNKCENHTSEAAKFQNEIHGAGMRVMNEKKKKDKEKQEYRCTICGNVK